MNSKEGFIYIWRDTKRNLYYLGSHMGSLDDGYIGSNNRLQCSYKSRPHTFKRRILEHYTSISQEELLARENAWLALIKEEDLHRVKYYNEKKVAAGGDIVSNLSDEQKHLHKNKSIAARRRGWDEWIKTVSRQELIDRGKYARSKVVNPRGGIMPGKLNPFYGKSHSEETRKIMSERAKKRNPNRIKEYIIKFPNDSKEHHFGQNSIKNKYCKEYPIKFSRFINKGIPVSSNRKTSKNNILVGATIETVQE